MSFPVNVTSAISLPNGPIARELILHKGLTVILGPNGAGKTQLLRGLKQSLHNIVGGSKKVCFVSAGRIGELESYRADTDGYREGTLRYDDASYGSQGEKQRRYKIETLNGSFQVLAARPDILVKVKERLRKLFRRDIEIRWDEGRVKVFFSHGEKIAYSSGREASGLLHLVGLLAMIYDDEIGALLLDEPEVSLHPQLQAFLLQEIASVSGWPEAESNKKIIVLCTHSTEFVLLSKPSDLLDLVFCTDILKAPTQISSEAGELQNRKISALVGRMGQEHKLALFSSSPLLVEGPSDVIVGSSVARKLDLQLEAGGSQVLPVIGKGQFSVVAKLFRLMGKDPVILADADALTDNLELANFVLNCPSADTAAAVHGAASACALASQVYNAFCQLVDTQWASIESEASKHPYWTEREQQNADQLKAKRRSAFSTLFVLSDESIRALAAGAQWASIKTRLITLLNLLEAQGCFILRKGAIESYFEFNPERGLASKPEMAALEAAYLSDADPARVRAVYGDVVRCLEFASAAEKIVEAEALQEVLLAVCTPALAKIRAGQSDINLNAIARSISPEMSGIFDLKAVDGKLQISLLSKVLNVSGFPITVEAGQDVITVVAAALKL